MDAATKQRARDGAKLITIQCAIKNASILFTDFFSTNDSLKLRRIAVHVCQSNIVQVTCCEHYQGRLSARAHHFRARRQEPCTRVLSCLV